MRLSLARLATLLSLTAIFTAVRADAAGSPPGCQGPDAEQDGVAVAPVDGGVTAPGAGGEAALHLVVFSARQGYPSEPAALFVRSDWSPCVLTFRP